MEKSEEEWEQAWEQEEEVEPIFLWKKNYATLVDDLLHHVLQWPLWPKEVNFSVSGHEPFHLTQVWKIPSHSHMIGQNTFEAKEKRAAPFTRLP